MKLSSFLLLLVCSFGVVAATSTDSDMSKQAILERIKPVAKLHISGAQAAQTDAGGPRSGEKVFSTTCFACHGTGVMGAPKIGDAAAWEPRIAQGIDTLLNHAINGLNAMPPKGTCNDCSDDELKAAIEHMIKDI